MTNPLQPVLRSTLPILAMVLLTIPCLSAAAETIRIPADQPTIAAGIGAADPGDTLLIACGTYYEHDLTVTEGITLASETGDDSCVTIDGGGAHQIMRIQRADGAIIRGITFTNGSAFVGGAARIDTTDVEFESCTFSDNRSSYLGGALYMMSSPGKSHSFTECTFSGNVSDISAGAVWAEDGSTVFDGCTFTGNDAESNGGAIGTYEDSELVLTDCDLTGNGSLGTSWGGAIFIDWNNTVTLSGCTFTGNTVENAGACLYIADGSTVDIDDCDFIDNTTPGTTAGVVGDNVAHLSITDCSFTGNEGNAAGLILIDDCPDASFERNTVIGNTSAGGGALKIDDSPMTVSDCLFADNAGGWGGVIEISDSDPTTIEGCTFTGNTIQMSGYGGCAVTVYGYDEIPSIAVNACVVSDNGGGDPIFCGDATATLSCSTVWGNADGDWVGSIAGQDAQNDNMASDPLFCDAAGGDYTVCADSPCLPANNGCSVLIGPYTSGCPLCGSPVESISWGAIKSLYR